MSDNADIYGLGGGYSTFTPILNTGPKNAPNPKPLGDQTKNISDMIAAFRRNLSDAKTATPNNKFTEGSSDNLLKDISTQERKQSDTLITIYKALKSGNDNILEGFKEGDKTNKKLSDTIRKLSDSVDEMKGKSNSALGNLGDLAGLGGKSKIGRLLGGAAKVAGGIGGAVGLYDGISNMAETRGTPLFGNEQTGGILGSRAANYGQLAVSGAATGAAIGSIIPGVGTAIGAGVGGAVGLGAGLITDYKPQISSFFDSIGKTVKSGLSETLTASTKIISSLFDKIGDAIPTWNSVKGFLGSIGSGGKDIINSIVSKMTDLIDSMHKWISDLVPSMADIKAKLGLGPVVSPLDGPAQATDGKPTVGSSNRAGSNSSSPLDKIRGIAQGSSDTLSSAGNRAATNPNSPIGTETSNTPMRNGVSGTSAASDDAHTIGAMSAKYEGTVGMVHQDNIGMAYGKYQFNSSTGGMQQFLKASPEYAEKFKGLTPGSAEFGKKWTEIAKAEPEKFEAAQDAAAKAKWYDPAAESATKAGFKMDNLGVQKAIFSGSIQHGHISDEIIQKVGKIPGFKDMTPEQQLNAFYDRRQQYVDGLGVNVGTRYKDERREAIATANLPKEKPRTEENKATAANTNDPSKAIPENVDAKFAAIGKIGQDKPKSAIDATMDRNDQDPSAKPATPTNVAADTNKPDNKPKKMAMANWDKPKPATNTPTAAAAPTNTPSANTDQNTPSDSAANNNVQPTVQPEVSRASIPPDPAPANNNNTNDDANAAATRNARVSNNTNNTSANNTPNRQQMASNQPSGQDFDSGKFNLDSIPTYINSGGLMIVNAGGVA